MELLMPSLVIGYRNEMDPAYYYIHSPRVPSAAGDDGSSREKALLAIPAERLW